MQALQYTKDKPKLLDKQMYQAKRLFCRIVIIKLAFSLNHHNIGTGNRKPIVDTMISIWILPVYLNAWYKLSLTK